MSDSKINSKEILAKLMATENIIVEHANVHTASFDLKNRKLLLPIWKDISDDVYTLLISHEVGHALYTPYVEWQNSIANEHNSEELKIIINIVEDVRIEKLIQNKFPGTIKSFRVGYNELENKNLFGTKDRNIESYEFLDRVNIHFKIGHFGYAKVPFADSEYVWLNKIANCNTFSDVVRVSKELLKFIQSSKQEDQHLSENSDSKSSNMDDFKSECKSNESDFQKQSSNNSSCSDDKIESDFSNENESDSANQPSSKYNNAKDFSSEKLNNKSHSCSSNGKIESETQSSFDSSLKKYIDNNVLEVAYANLPDIDLSQIIVNYKTVHSQIRNFYTSYYPNRYDSAKIEVESYKLANKNVVNQLANIFEMKKKAKMDAKVLVSRTGKLDTNKVFSYRYSDDIFKKHTTIPEGKSHGLIMFLDMSGSMNDNMMGTYEQLLNLVLFCRRINIPFDVYGFTDSVRGDWKRNYKNGDLVFDSCFSLRQYFSNTMSAAEFNEALQNILMLMNAYKAKGRNGYSSNSVGIPNQEVLNQTPMVPAILTAIKIVPEFRKKYSLDIVNVIFLSDGEDTHGTLMMKDDKLVDISKNNYWRTYKNRNNKYYINDPKTKKQWEIVDSTKTSFEILKQLTGVRVIGFHIISKKHLQDKLTYFEQKNISEKLENFKINKYCEINNAKGYDAYYLIPSDKGLRISSSEFEPAVDTTVDKNDHKQAKKIMKNVAKDFSNYMRQKIINRVLLSRFIEQIS